MAIEQNFLDELELLLSEIEHTLKALRRRRRKALLDNKRQKMQRLHDIIRLFEDIRTKIGELLLAELGDSPKIQKAIVSIRSVREELDETVDRGIDKAKDIEKVSKVAKTAGAILKELPIIG